ncbi:unnamed protein product [Schistosoma margrebowiei]|uniref:Uncharacterized protein n=1 Tax=Schistosoma margrebowiei TaxID=48269 RepID=A0A183LQD3_9TREM|nr:unnamed protein product [Schistosoma margrebowiei]
MWETGKTSQIAMEMRRYNLAVLGISETHWTQAGQKRLATGEMLVYSGHEEDNAPHTQGVALMLSKVARNALKYVEELATTAEKAAREGNMKQLYDTTKKLAGKYSKPERPVKDKESNPITEIQQQRNRWVEYFEELLNRLAPMNPPDIKAAHTDLPIDVNPPTTEEIRMAVRQIKNGKAAGPGNIPAEALTPNCNTTDHRRTIS